MPSEAPAPRQGEPDREVAVRIPVKVIIYNQAYTLVTSSDPAEVEELGHVVDDLVTGIAARGGNIDTTRAAVLACLHLADKVRNLERDLSGYQRKFLSEHRKFAGLLDQALAPGENVPGDSIAT